MEKVVWYKSDNRADCSQLKYNVRLFNYILIGIILLTGTRLYSQVKFYNYYDNGLEFIEKGDWQRAIDEFKSASSMEFEDTKKKRTYGTRFIKYFPHREMGIAYYNLGEFDNAKKELALSIAYKSSKRANEFLSKLTDIKVPDVAKNAAALAELKKLEEEESRIAADRERLALQKAEEERIHQQEEIRLKQEIEAAELAKLEKERKLQAEEEHLAAERTRIAQAKLASDQLKAEKEKLALEQLRIEQERTAEAERLAAEEKRIKEEQERLAKAQREMEAREQDLERKRKNLEKSKKKWTFGQKTLPVGALTYDPNKVARVGSRLSVAVMPIIIIGDGNDADMVVTETLITKLVNLKRFKVIERSAIDKIMAEQSLAMSGIVDESSAIAAGKIIGADAILLGSISRTAGYSKINARIIDTETSETIVAKDVETTNADIENMSTLVENLAILIYNDLPLVEGYIVNIDDNEIYLDVGINSGIRKGSKFVAFREGNQIVHPATGEILGIKRTKLGELVAMQVQDKMTIAKIVEDEGSLEIGDKIVVK